MLLVVDTSAILAVLLNEPSKEALIALTAEAELAAPVALHWEIGNALSALLKRKRLTLNEARQVIREYKLIPLRLLDVGLDDSLVIAAKYEIYAYDAYFVACAQHLSAPLITLDSGLMAAARASNIAVVEVPT